MRTISFRHRLPALPTALALAAGVIGCGSEKGPTEPAIPPVASVQVTPAFDTLTALGQTHQLAAVAKDASGTPISGKTFTWASSAPSVVSVDAATGLATAVANGDAKITATVGDKSGQAALTVEQQVATVTVTPPTASLTAIGATQQFAAVAKDANNNPVAGAVFLWLSANHNVATIDAAGLATATGPGSVTITAAARGIPGTAALAVAQAATKLGFSVPPTNATAGQAMSPAVQVEIRDAGGGMVSGARDAVTLVLETNPASGTLSGTKTVNAVGGVATFSGLSVDKAGTGYTLVALSGALASATSAGFDIGPSAPAKLGFTAQPSTATAGVAISPAVQIAVQDQFGNTVSSATVLLTVAIGDNPGGGALSGTPTVSAVNGVATFNNLSISKAASRYTLSAVAAGLAGATSAAFDISPGPAASLAIVVQPRTTQGAQPITPGVQVAIQDAFANTVTSATNAITLAIATNPGGGRLSGTTTTNAVSGIATFADLTIDRPGTGYTLAATAANLAGVTSAAFDIRLVFARVSAGRSHACGVTSAGAAYCWGGNGYGQLGNGTTNVYGEGSPVLVLGGLSFATLSAGDVHTCGLTTGGAAYCWGDNSAGQLGTGTTMSSSSPVLVSGGLSFATVSTGNLHTCGVTSAGAAYCWGYNSNGQLGDGTTSIRTSPVPIGKGLSFAAVSAGGSHTCGVTSTGAAYCWGNNANGQLGDGTTIQRTSPVAVLFSPSFATVSAGFAHTCGVTSAGAGRQAYCWGSNIDGQLGDGTTTQRTSPVVVVGVLSFAAVNGVSFHTCTVTSAGAAYCWGDNSYGQLGDGTTTQRTSPVVVLGVLSFAAISAGDLHTCGVTSAGAAYCWGYNSSGQLGDGTFATNYVPVRVVQ